MELYDLNNNTLWGHFKRKDTVVTLKHDGSSEKQKQTKGGILIDSSTSL